MTEFERFLRRLIDVLEAQDPEGVHKPLSVADLRRTVMPYRLHRSAIGLTSAEDYELLVLRLVAEEGGYARTWPGESAELARAEVASPNPDLDLVEKLGDTTVQIGASGRARIAAAIAADLEAEEAALAEEAAAAFAAGPGAAPANPEERQAEPVAPTAAEPVEEPPVPASPGDHREEDISSVATVEWPSPTPVPSPEPAPAPPPPAPEPVFEPLADTISVDSPQAPAPTAAAPVTCQACHATLPTHRAATFCPFCGHQVGNQQCSRCGSEIEPGWRHCIVCGQQAAPGAFA